MTHDSVMMHFALGKAYAGALAGFLPGLQGPLPSRRLLPKSACTIDNCFNRLSYTQRRS